MKKQYDEATHTAAKQIAGLVRPEMLTEPIKAWLVAHHYVGSLAEKSWEAWKNAIAYAVAGGELSLETFQELTNSKLEDLDMTTATPEKVYGGTVHVKSPSARFSDFRYKGKNKHGQEVLHPTTGAPAELPSQRDHAIIGAIFKHVASRAGLGCTLTELERELVQEAATTMTWVGEVDGQYQELAGGPRIKALIDDVTSGGLEITPIFFDERIVTFPLLGGELFPQVDVVDLPRGRRVEGASVANVTFSWGAGDNVTASLFSTASMVAAIDTTIFGCALAMEVGRDFLSDAAVNVGQVLTQLVGQRMAQQLDYVIAEGNGTTQPEGIFTATGVSSVTPDNAATGPPTLADYFDLYFGISKQYRTPAYNPCFLSNDTTYSRSRQIRVDPQTSTTDQRPVLAPLTDVASYTTLGRPHLIENSLSNRYAAFVGMKAYRLYRRQGLAIQFETGGTTLQRSNLALLIARGRFGGRLMDANAACKWTTGQS